MIIRYEPLVGARLCAVQRTNGYGSRTAHGNGTAFSAVAPSERPVLSIDPIFGSGFDQARTAIQRSGPIFGSALASRLARPSTAESIRAVSRHFSASRR